MGEKGSLCKCKHWRTRSACLFCGAWSHPSLFIPTVATASDLGLHCLPVNHLEGYQVFNGLFHRNIWAMTWENLYYATSFLGKCSKQTRPKSINCATLSGPLQFLDTAGWFLCKHFIRYQLVNIQNSNLRKGKDKNCICPVQPGSLALFFYYFT